jgi:hypothetical protein
MSEYSRDRPLRPRRHLLRGALGLGLGLAAMNRGTAPASAQTASAAPPRSMTPAGMTRDLPADAGSFPPAVFPRTAPFDLSRADERALARLKVIVNLVGRRAYVSVMSRHFLCPPNQPPRPWINELELFTMFLERLPAGAVQRSVFTRVFVDPATLEPVREVRNPFDGSTLAVDDRLFALTLPLRLEAQSTVRNTTESELPIVRFGEWVDIANLAVREGEGFHQPSFDTSTWRARHAQLQNPRVGLLDAHYAFSSLLRGSLLSWAGMARDDPTQVLTHKTGLKTHDPLSLSEPVRRLIVSRYPDRV